MGCDLYKARAVFNEENRKRVHEIVQANGELGKLAEISPSFIVMDLTWDCNYECSCCIDGNVVNQEQGFLEVDLIEDIFDYCNSHDVRGVMTMGGEVFLYKKGIRKALEKSLEYQIPMKTVSNGSQLREFIPEVVQAYQIPGSTLRISINSDEDNYLEQTKSNVPLKYVFGLIKEITSQGTPVLVSTVVFPESSRKDDTIPNIFNLEKIIGYCEDAGVSEHLLLPGRNPLTRRAYGRSDEEKKVMKKIGEKAKTGYGTRVEMETYQAQRYCEQNLNFEPCPSGFIFTLVGSDGKVYKCTDNRGKDSMMLGQIKKPGDFEKFWHSEERVKRQIETPCKNQGCGRYAVNSRLDACRNCYSVRGVDFSEDFEILNSGDIIYI